MRYLILPLVALLLISVEISAKCPLSTIRANRASRIQHRLEHRRPAPQDNYSRIPATLPVGPPAKAK